MIKKIVFSVTVLEGGGTEKYVLRLCEALTALGGYSVFVVLDRGCATIESDWPVGVERIVLPTDVLSSRSSYVNAFRRILSRIQPFIVHLNGWERIGWLEKSLIVKEYPFVRTWHATYGVTNLWSFFNLMRVRTFFRVWGGLIRFGSPRVPIISISKASYDNGLKMWGAAFRSRIIYNGAPSLCLNKIKRVPGCPIKLIWVGGLVERKRPMDAVRIAQLLSDAGVNFSLNIVGDGPLRPALKRYLDERSLSDVQLLGYSSEINVLLQESDVLIFTSELEGMPLAIIEAMSAGLAVVCSNFLTANELVLDNVNGYVVNVGDVEGFFDKLLLLQDDERLTAFSSASRERWFTLFQWSDCVKSTLRYYSDVVEDFKFR